MEISRLLSSALRFSDVRSRQMITSPRPRRTIKNLGTYKSSLIRPSRFEYSKNGSHGLKAVPVKAQAKQGEAASSFEAGAKSEHPKKNDVIWRFLRPFPVIFTFIQFSSILARVAMVENPHVLQMSNWSMFIKLFAAVISISCTNIYAACINQIFDIGTDKINKPYLPLCSGELPIESAWLITMGLVAISSVMAGTINSLSFLAFNFCLLLVASSYSIPPIRTKASTFGAPITITMLNGFGQFFVMLAGIQAALGLSFYMRNNIPTVATIIGVRKTLLIGLGTLILNHFGAISLVFIHPESFKSSIMIPFHILSILFMLYQARKVDNANYEVAESMKTYLTFLGVLLAQILLFPFI